VPERTGGRARLAKEIRLMKNNLKEAVVREDFEQAAQLRDKIHLMEKTLKEGGEGDAHEKNS
jgi:protein arginine kinase activator